MARSQSRLTAEIDFDRDGKQHGFIRLPYSVHRSAYGWIPIPPCRSLTISGAINGHSCAKMPHQSAAPRREKSGNAAAAASR